MRKLVVILILAFFNQAKAQTYNIILGRPTNTSVTASILFDQTAQFYFEFGLQSGSYNSSTTIINAVGEKPEEVNMDGLLPNKKYFYRVRYKFAGFSSFLVSPEYSFNTQRSKDSTFTFTIEADEHLYDIKGVRSLYQICLNNQAKDKPDFMLSLGDIFGDDHNPYTITKEEIDVLHKDYRPLLGSICHSIPFYVCLGNHEGENDFYFNQNPPNNLCIMGTQSRKYYYPNPFPNNFYSGNTALEPYGIGYPENYYAWEWGNALFVVLDVYRYQCDTTDKPGGWSWTLGKPQYDWLKKTLEQSTSKYKFVFAHHIRGQGRGGITNAKLFEWGGYEQNGVNFTFPGKRPGWAKPIHQLFKDNGVNIFFQGHDHVFAREVMDGVVYQAVPMPSDSTYLIGKLANADAYTSDTFEGSGHLRVNVSPSCIKVDFVRAYLPKDTLAGAHKNGEVAFSYTIGTCSNNSGGGSFSSITEPVIVYPNPAKDYIYLTFKEAPLQLEVKIFNSVGQLVMQTVDKSFSIAKLPSGFYVVQIQTEKNRVSKNLIINK